MLLHRLVQRLPVKSHWARMILGAALVAVLVSLGMVAVLELLDYANHWGLVGALAGTAAASYAINSRRTQRP